MQNPNHPAGKSSTPEGKSPPPSSSQHPPLPPPSVVDTNTNMVDLNISIQNTNTNSGGRGGKQPPKILKTPREVWEELTTDDNPNADGGIMGQSGGSNGVSVAVAVGASDGGDKQRGGGKRRKVSDVKDPPSGDPICPICDKEFRSWKGAFGHMRKHPDRTYRGFHEPPCFTTPSSLHAAGNKGVGEGSRTGQGRAAASHALPFDLNEPIIDESGSSNAADQRNKEGLVSRPAGEEKILRFDLNRLPSDEDENEDQI